jgi:hypothetical protein
MKTKNQSIYIPSIDGKDVYLSNMNNDKIGFTLKSKDGKPNLRRYKNVFDYSLDLLELRKIAKSVFWGKQDKFTFTNKGKEYCPNIINLNFEYSVKDFNKTYTYKNGKNYEIWIKYGYKVEDLKFEDCIAKNQNDEIVGVICGKEIIRKSDINGFDCVAKKDKHDEISLMYKKRDYNKTIKSLNEIREHLYINGFVCDGIKYVRFKRSSGSARVGKCLFINELLYDKMFEYAKCGLNVNNGDEIDLASFEAYISLTTSSIIDTIEIEPKNFLIIDDFESIFEEEAVITKIKDGFNELETYQDIAKIKNSIFDGQGLIDISIMGEYKDKGMLLLRNNFFKSCCFNTNIQDFFKDNNITDISQLNGFTLADNIEDIKLITTPSSIKYFKFDKNFENWFKNISSTFGIVKYDKDTHYFDGSLVQTHYQLINTLQFTEDEMKSFLQPSLDYLDGLNMDKHIMRNHVKWKEKKEDDTYNLKTNNDIIYTMLGFDNGFENTKIYHQFKEDIRKSFIKNIKKGHVYINGTYAVLLGNPYEMLLQSIGMFNGNQYMENGTIHNIRYKDNEQVLCCRSPHVTISNILLSKNKHYDLINKYFNLTNNIICINSIGENILERLSGADFDSDSCIITNDKLLIDLAKINYDVFKVPTSLVEARKTKRYYTKEQLADLDVNTSDNKIGEIINCSQILNSLLWDKLYQLKKDTEIRGSAKDNFNEIKDLFYDICQLDVMSCIEIDKAKKEFIINNSKELNRIKSKYKGVLTDEKGKAIKPEFFKFLNKSKGYFIKGAKNYLKHETAMDYLSKTMNEKKYCSQKRNKEYILFSNVFQPTNYDLNARNKPQVKDIRNSCERYVEIKNKIWIDSDKCSKEEIEEKRIETKKLQDDLIYDFSNLSINESTMYELIKTIDMEKYSKIRGIMFKLIFVSNNKSINNLLNSMKIDTKITKYSYFNTEFSA